MADEVNSQKDAESTQTTANVNVSLNSNVSTNADTTTTFVIPKNVRPYSEQEISNSKIAPALAGLYFVPGLGEALVTATGVVIIGGITYKVGSSVYNLVKKSINSGKAKKKHTVADDVPSRLKKSKNSVDLKKFNKKRKKRCQN